MEGFKAQGSFGIPSTLQKQMDEARRANLKKKTEEAPQNDAPPVAAAQPAPASAAPAEQAPEVDPTKAQQEKFEKIKSALEQSLDTKITEEDIKEYIFKGRIVKDVQIIPGILKGSFQTLTTTQYMEIDERVAEMRSRGKNTQEGYDNDKAIINLSFSWIAADGRPLSSKDDPKIREKYIRSMGAHLVDCATAAMNDFNTLVRLTLQEKNFVKKS